MECALCTEEFTNYGLPQCGHKTICSLCWYRMRSLLDNKSCPLCRQTSDYLFITSNTSLVYNSLISTLWNDSIKGFTLDLQSQIYFEDQSELQRLLSFKRLNCKVCLQESKNFNNLKDHLMRFHAKRICEVCSKNNNLFASEQDLYDETQLGIHKLSHHVQCELCFDYYYDQRKLLEHIKTQHFFCELCEVMKRTAYRTYEDLEAHYRQAHYLCEVSICRQDMHTVFLCYDDLRDHYRSNHPGIIIPQPVCAFKIRDEEEKPVMFFDDVSSKNYSAPKISEETKDFEFPALGGNSSSKKEVLDYSKIGNKNQGKTGNSLFPQSFFPIPVGVPGFVPPKPQTKTSKAKKKQEQPEIMKNISRLNTCNITVEEFVSQIPEENLLSLPETIQIIKTQVISNSFKEKIVQELEKMLKTRQNLVNPQKSSNFETEETKSLKKPEISEKSSTKTFDQSSFPVLGNVRPTKAKSEFNTLLDNIAIYNNKLISAKCFVENLLEFMPRTEINLFKSTIKEKIRDGGRAEVMNILERALLLTANETEYPALAPAKQVYQKTGLELLRDHLKLLREGMMTSKEFIIVVSDQLEKEQVLQAVKIIKEKISNSAQANKISKEILANFKIVDYQEEYPALKMARIPPEPKRKK